MSKKKTATATPTAINEGCIVLEVPLVPPRANIESLRPAHVEVQLNQEQGHTLRRLFDGYDQAGLRLRNGKRVGSHADAVRLLLEGIHDANGAAQQ